MAKLDVNEVLAISKQINEKREELVALENKLKRVVAGMPPEKREYKTNTPQQPTPMVAPTPSFIEAEVHPLTIVPSPSGRISQDKVWQALENRVGVFTAPTIARYLNISTGAVSNHLNSLEKDGKLERITRGKYRVNDPDRVTRPFLTKPRLPGTPLATSAVQL